MIKNFDTLNRFFSDEAKAIEGVNYISTLGYATEFDGGAGVYRVEEISGTPSNGRIFDGLFVTENGYKLELIPENNTVYVEQFGAKGDCDLSMLSEADKSQFYEANSAAIQCALNSGISTIVFSAKTYLVSGDITISNSVNVVGNSAVIEMRGNNTSVIKLSNSNYCVEDVTISDITLRGKDISSTCTLLWGENVARLNVERVNFENCNRALFIFSGDENSYGINLSNCCVKNVLLGFELDYVTEFKIRNIRIELADNENSIGLVFRNDTCYGLVEDVSVYYAGDCAVLYEGNSDAWENFALQRIFFKNLLVDESNYGIKATYNEIPLSFSNMMLVNVNYGIYLECAKNLVVTNSSVVIKSPSTAADDAAAICVRTYAHAKFIHTQFDFPHSFKDISTYDEGEPCEFSFVDCTIQKTDIAGVDGVVEPTGFGYITDTHSLAAKFIETFDACEFRSYIKDYSVTMGEGEIAVTTYNFPITLSPTTDSGSKLIIKNCRFVNDSTCTVPYFKLDDNAKFDNIVVYNCFFENYNYTDPNNASDFPIFGKLTNNGISCDVSDHNIFAKCNMRSSEPDRINGTTINEMVTYE